MRNESIIKTLNLVLSVFLIISCTEGKTDRITNITDYETNSVIAVQQVDINYLDEFVSEIDKNIDLYSIENKSFLEKPSEGGGITYYYANDGNVVKIVATYYGASEQKLQEFYFKDSEPLVLRETVSHYDLNLLVNSGEYSISDIDVIQYYFADRKLAKVKHEEEKDNSVKNLQTEEKRIINDIDYLLNL